jgi:hypothetical protein
VKPQPLNAETPLEALAHARTPTGSSFVRNNHPEPELPAATHRIAVEGAVEAPFTPRWNRLGYGNNSVQVHVVDVG